VQGWAAVMLICAGLAAVATVTSLVYLPGRAPKPVSPPAQPEKAKTEAF
jgi:predicted MFS family arabinose efflux permease